MPVLFAHIPLFIAHNSILYYSVCKCFICIWTWFIYTTEPLQNLCTTFTQPLHTLCIIFTIHNLPMLLVFPFHPQFCWTSRGRAWRWLRWLDMPMPCGWDVAFQVFQAKGKKKVGLVHLGTILIDDFPQVYRFPWFLTEFPGHVRSVGRWKGRIGWHLGMWSQSPNVGWFHGRLTSYRKLEPVAWFKHQGKSQRLLLI